MNEVNDPAKKKISAPIELDSFGKREKWFALALWTMPIWWLYFYRTLLWAGNQLTSHFGCPLYLMVHADWLKAVLVGGYLVALVFCSRIPKWSKQQTFYTIVIWFFIVAFSGITQGALTAGLEVAAGRPMSACGH